jgi:hypothetical protein
LVSVKFGSNGKFLIKKSKAVLMGDMTELLTKVDGDIENLNLIQLNYKLPTEKSSILEVYFTN